MYHWNSSFTIVDCFKAEGWMRKVVIITNYPMMMLGNQFKYGGGVCSHLFFWNCNNPGPVMAALMCWPRREGQRFPVCIFKSLILITITLGPCLSLHSNPLPVCFFLGKRFVAHMLQNLSSVGDEIFILLTRGPLAFSSCWLESPFKCTLFS